MPCSTGFSTDIWIFAWLQRSWVLGIQTNGGQGGLPLTSGHFALVIVVKVVEGSPERKVSEMIQNHMQNQCLLSKLLQKRRSDHKWSVQAEFTDKVSILCLLDPFR